MIRLLFPSPRRRFILKGHSPLLFFASPLRVGNRKHRAARQPPQTRFIFRYPHLRGMAKPAPVVYPEANPQMRRTAPKVVLCGDQNVGKTAIVRQIFAQQFQTTSTTLGMEFSPVDINGIPLNLWDLAGQMRASAYNTTNFRNANAIIAVCDSSNRASLANLEVWLRQVRSIWERLYGSPPPHESCRDGTDMPVLTFLVFNKIDLEMPDDVECQAIAKQLGCQRAFLVTATQYGSVKAMFDVIAAEVANRPAPAALAQARPQPAQSGGGCPCGGGKNKQRR